VTDSLDRILALVREHIPDLQLVHKHELRWMRVLGRAVRPIAPDFDTHYTTVLGNTVYLPRPPDEMPRRVLAATLAHELVHQLDQRRWGLLFYATYAWALPTGRTMRAYWERRAYAVDLLIAKDRGGEREVENVAKRLADVFSGSSYLWMWVGRAAARAYLQPTVEAVLTGELERQGPYDVIMAAWRGASDPDAAT
jgi:hypothetical protein